MILTVTANTTLDLTFANNLTSRPTVVFEGKDHIWPVTANQWDNIGLQRTFTYLPPMGNLVIEVIAIGNDRLDSSGTVGFYSYAGARTYAFTWTGTPPLVASGGDTAAALKMRLGAAQPAVDIFGKRCGPGPLAIAASGSGKIGTLIDTNLTSGPNAGAGIMWLGLTTSPPFPIDLTPLGYTGCRLQCSIDLTLGAVAFSSGTSTSIKFLLPNATVLANFQFALEGLALDSTAPGGTSVSDWARVLIGL
jgi:hypothetical protein